MKPKIRGVISLALILLLSAVSAGARQSSGGISAYLPASGEAAGWNLDGEPERYQGEDLFRMINGGADIYHEYGFRQVVRAEYLGPEGKSVKLEIYQMVSPAAAYGIYTFKAGERRKSPGDRPGGAAAGVLPEFLERRSAGHPGWAGFGCTDHARG